MRRDKPLTGIELERALGRANAWAEHSRGVRVYVEDERGEVLGVPVGVSYEPSMRAIYIRTDTEEV